MKNIELIGAVACIGARDHRCESGPLVVRSRGIIQHLNHQGFHAHWKQFVMPYIGIGDARGKTLQISRYCAQLAEHLQSVVASNRFFTVLGGDHSCAIGTWSGACVGNPKRMGLLWIDAHMDSHTPETSHSGAIHGMPLAALLGHGDADLINIASDHPKFDPQDVCVVGVRSFEQEEQALLDRLGVRVFFMDEIRRRGIDLVLREALAHVQRNTTAVGISIDLDAIDPLDAPGVGSPERGGIEGASLIAALRSATRDVTLIGTEIVEFNPILDRSDRTVQLIFDLVDAMLPRAA